MPVEFKQSAIAEVRDQLFLDWADGKYLNTVTANVGLTRPPFGYDDTTWRAIAKIVGLNYKQIATQFEEVFGVLFGPKITQATSLSENVLIGDKQLSVHSVERVPQVGTLVLNEGLANEETFTYCFVDRRNNIIYLDDATTFGHAKADRDASGVFLNYTPVIGAKRIILSDTSNFPTTYPYPVVLGRGTPQEEVVNVTNNDIVGRTLTVSTIANTHTIPVPKSISDSLEIDYTTNTYYTSLISSARFPESGVIQLTNPPEFTSISGTTTTAVTAGGSFRVDQHVGRTVVFFGNVTPALANVTATITANTDSILSFAALANTPAAGDAFYIISATPTVSGTTADVTVAASTFTPQTLVGNQITFVGNVTPALRNVTLEIIENTGNVVTFGSAAGSAPASGDLFYFRPRVVFTRNSYEDNDLVLKLNIPGTFPKGTKVELLNENEDALYSQVKIGGSSWAVIQTDPTHLELLLPEDLESTPDVRSTSYLHPEYDSTPPATTSSAITNIGSTRMSLTNPSSFPVQGVLNINSGAEYIGYRRTLLEDTINLSLSSNTPSGAVIRLVTGGLTVNALAGETVFIGEQSGVVASTTTNTITFTRPFENEFFESLIDQVTKVRYYDEFWVDFAEGNTNSVAHANGVAVSLHEVPYPGTDVLNGNFRTVPNTYPGPYLYEFGSHSPLNLQNVGHLTQYLAGPMLLELDQLSTRSAIEVTDASFVPLTGFPYPVIIGAFSSSRETTDISDVGLRQRTATTVDQPSIIGQTYIEVVALGAAAGARFPNASGYRVRIGRGTANDEIIYVTGVNGTFVPPRLLCEPTTNVHAATEIVELVADVIAVTNLTKNHRGFLTLSDRTNIYPSITDTARRLADGVQVAYESISLSSTTGLEPIGSVTLNYGHGKINSRARLDAPVSLGASTLSFSDSSVLPTTGFPYPLRLGEGTRFEEIVHVTANNTGTNELTISHPTRHAHLERDYVAFEAGAQESIEYSSIVGNTLRFSSPVVLKSNHHIEETALGSIILAIINKEGYDFPLRLPPSLLSRLEFLFDLLRAAGVQVTIISAR